MAVSAPRPDDTPGEYPAQDDNAPRPDELPGGETYADIWSEAERVGDRFWRNATDEERIRSVTAAAVQRRKRREDVVIDRSAGGIDAADLLALDLPPLRWIVPDLICEGTSVIAAPPKIGKSCLVYQSVVETSIGGELFGRRVTPGSALYLALEDGARRGRDRLRAALGGRVMPRGRLEVRWSAPLIGQGLEDSIARWLDDHADATIVAIDTLGKVRARGDGRANAYQTDVDDLGRLQGLFRDRQVALVIVHHARKEAGDDFLASVSGTYGVTGSADTIIVAKRPGRHPFGTLTVTGRDVPDAEIPVEFDGLTWRSAPAIVPQGRFERAEVYDLVRQRGPIFPKAIADALEKERTAVQHMVSAMADDGTLARTGRGYVVVDRSNVLTLPLHPPHSPSEISEGGQYAGAREDDDDYPASSWDTAS